MKIASHHTQFLPSALAIAIAAALPSAALAQTSDVLEGGSNESALEEIIVRAMKRDQTIFEVPISMTAVTEQELQALGSQDLNDYVGFIPNLTVTSGEGGRRGWDVSIRGLSAVQGVAGTFGIFVDEFNVSPTSISAFNNPSLQDAAQVEVLRGPQGIYFGRSVMAGAISVTSNKPSDEFQGSIAARAGSNDRYMMRANVSGPLIEDVLSYRAVGYYEEFGGFMDNIGPSDADDSFDEHGFRLALRWTPSERTTIDFSALYQDAEDGLNNVVPIGIWPAFISDLNTALSFGVIDSVETLAALQGTRLYPGVEHEVNVDDETTRTIEASIFMVRAEHEFDNFSLIGVAGYMDGKQRREVGEADFNLNETNFITPFGAEGIFFGDYSQVIKQEVESWSLELRAQSNSSGPMQWVLGAIVSEDEEFQSDDDFIKWGSEVNGRFNGFEGPFGPSFDYDLIESFAIFGDVSYAFLDDRLTLSAGGRYSEDTFTSNGAQFEAVAIPEPLIRPEASDSFYDFSPTVTAAWAVSDTVNVYAKAASAYRSGGLNNNAQVPPSYGPEELWNYEVGVKGLFLEGALDLRLAIFRMDWEDVQVTEIDTSVGTELGLLSFIGNAGEAIIEGAELETSWTFGENWLWQVGIGYTDAEYITYDSGFVSTEVDPVDLGGTPLPNAPEWTFNTQLQYDFTLENGADVYLRGEYLFTDEQFSEPGGARFDAFVLDSYEVFNLRAGYTTSSYSISAFAENIFDEIYLQGTFFGINPMGINGVVNEGRRFGIRGEYFF
ncbi:MAG: TonB-dependent receptor [Pseudomonadota bacterium]